MILRPIKRLTNRPVGLVITADHVIGEWGETRVADAPKNAALFAVSHKRIFEEIRTGRGRARYWKKRYVGYEIDGRKIYGMRDILAKESAADAFEYLHVWAEWVRSHNANISSLPSTAWSIWRSTLSRKIVLAVNKLPMPRELMPIGGRQEAVSGHYSEAVQYDISGAYQFAMQELLVGRAYRYVPGRVFCYRPDFPIECVGFARASVELPFYRGGNRSGDGGLVFGPIPHGTRNSRFPTFGKVDGIFDLQELRMAHECGAKIRVEEVWIGRGLRFPWRKWSDIISTGRALPGRAGKMVKFMGNSLWGSFAVHGRGSWVSFPDGQKRATILHDPKETVPPCRPLSAHISAFVRCRLYREILDNYSAAHWLIAAHTDGAILQDPAFPNGPMGDGLGEWRKRADLRNLALVTAQAYCFINSAGEKEYVVAGSPPEFAPQVFRAILDAHNRRAERERVPHLLE